MENAALVETEILAPLQWDEPVGQFSKSTGIVVTLYDRNGQIVSGPHTPNPLTAEFRTAGAWREGSAHRQLEVDLVSRVVRSGTEQSGKIADLLPVRAFPVCIGPHVIGVFVLGWMFDHFADPIESDRLAKALEIPQYELWQLIRAHVPLAPHKLQGYSELLSTIAAALVTEAMDRRNERRTSRILRVLNQSAQALTSASTIADIAHATLDAVLALSGSAKVEIFFADEDGKIDFSQRDLSFSKESPLAEITAPLVQQFPVQALDGALLAKIQVELDKSFLEPSQIESLRSEIAALSSQVAVAVQKARLISDLQKQKGALQVTLDELRRASMTRDEFLATVSHELRSPLNAMLGWCQILRMGAIDDSKREIALETIERNARVQAQLIEDLLDISRIISGKMQLNFTTVDLLSVISEAVKTVRPAAEAKSIRVQVDLSTKELVVRADPLRMQQVFWNLLSNAVKYTPTRGLIVVGVTNQGGDISITVSDTGEGIDNEFLPRLFDRFSQQDSTTTRSHGGLGLGLAIVKQIVELHGGTVTAASRGNGLGSVFRVTLPEGLKQATLIGPELEALPAPAAAPVPTKTNKALQGLRVLIVDDLSDSRNLMKVFASMQGAVVQDAESVQKAFEVLRFWVPDLIVSDIAMPEEDGYAFMKRLRALPEPTLKDIPSIAATAYARDEDRLLALQSGFNGHVTKPVDPVKFVATIADVASQTEWGRAKGAQKK